VSARLARWRRHAGVRTFLVLLLALWMVPEIYTLSVSVRTPAAVFDPTLFALPVTFDNFVTVVRDNPLVLFFVNSLVITVATVAIVVGAASLFAYATAILHLPGTLAFHALLLTTLMVPIASLILPLAILLKGFGWINSYLGLILPYAALGTPFAIVILKAFMEQSPHELYEAAAIDGCSSWQTYRHVALPLVRPAIVFVAIWQFIVTWNEFFLALIVMTDPAAKTLTLVPMQYSGLYMANPGALFAVLVIIAAPLVLLYVIVQRYFVDGLLAGAVKG
jgi:raffinose/stachyose/melibiose transport system permease protein